MLTGNHMQPQPTCSARLPWRRTRLRLAPYIGGTNILCVYRQDGVPWWSDGAAVFRDRHGFQIVGLIRRRPRPADAPTAGGAS